MFPRVIQFLSGRTLVRPAARSISALLQCSILAMIAVSAFTGVNISVGESAQGGVLAQLEIGGGEVWAADENTGEAEAKEAMSNGNKKPTAANSVTSADKDEVWKTITSLVNGIIGIFFFVATPFLMLVWWLMTPDWVFGEIFGFRPVLHSLWVLVSNVVYVIFAFLLVVMAFMNIFAGEKNTWAIKTKLPKLIIGIISVPFTWFFVSAVVSISSVLTASAIQLAGDLVPNGSEFEVPRYECTLDFNKNPVEKNANGDSISPEICKKVGTPKPLSEYLKSGEAYGLVSYYAYGIFQIQDIKKLTDTKLKTVKTVLDMGVGLLLALIIFVIFALIIIALVVALLTRAIYFWAIAVCSPLLSLAYFFDGKIGFWESWLSPRKIIDLAMVPVYVALALALGLVFISAVGSTPDLKLKSDYVKNVSTTDMEQTFTILDNTITVKGDPLGATAVIKDAKSLGGGVLGGFLIKILALCIMWFAVMAAFKASKITGDMVEPISKFGSEIGGMIKKLPQYAPIIPTGHGKASISSLSRISSTVSAGVDAKYGSGRGGEIGGKIADALNLSTAASKKTEEAIKYIDWQRSTSNPIEQATMFKQMTSIGWLDHNAYAIPRNREILGKYVGKLESATPDQKKELQDLVSKLNGQEGPFQTFLTRLKEVTKDATIDEVREINKIAKDGVSSAAANSGASAVTPKLTIMVDANNTKNLDIQVAAWEMSNFGTQATQATFADIKTVLVGKTPTEKSALVANVKTQLSTAWINRDDQVEKILGALGLR